MHRPTLHHGQNLHILLEHDPSKTTSITHPFNRLSGKKTFEGHSQVIVTWLLIKLWELLAVYIIQIFLDSFSSEEVDGIGPLHNPVTRYKKQKGTKSHLLVSKLRSGTSKTMQLAHLDLPLFGSPTAQLAHQQMWFCTMWPDCANGLSAKALSRKAQVPVGPTDPHWGSMLVFMLIKRLVGVLLLSLNKMLVN